MHNPNFLSTEDVLFFHAEEMRLSGTKPEIRDINLLHSAINALKATFDEILDNKYGKRGVPKREKWEQEFEAFRLGVLLEKARTKLGMTQEELAKKCRTNKSYISRIENNASDIRLSTLMKIIQQGLGGHLKLTLQL